MGSALIAGGVAKWTDSLWMETVRFERFWTVKAFQDSPADLVLIGDSRVYRGLWPEEIERHLPNSLTKVYNFGFSAAGLEPAIFRAAEKILRMDSVEPAFVIGVTPHSLTDIAAKNDHYHRLRKTPLPEVWMVTKAPLLWAICKNGKVASEVAKNPGERVYYDSGFMATHEEANPDPQRGVDIYRKIFTESQVLPELTEGLLRQVREWTAQGITVYGFRPPTTPAMRKLENEMSGLDYELFVRRFEENGGHWIEIEADAYKSYDGSHIDGFEARRLSEEIGIAIAAEMTPDDGEIHDSARLNLVISRK